MGYETLELRARMRVSRHNSPEDDRDNEAWNDFVTEVKALTRRYGDAGSYGIMVEAEMQPEDQWPIDDESLDYYPTG